jgi:hypothetical protein
MSRSYVAKALREEITKDARHRCGYCLTSARIIGAPLEIEHIIPESLGGPHRQGEPLARVLDVQRPQGQSDRRSRPAHGRATVAAIRLNHAELAGLLEQRAPWTR